jgi:hypothetical protein
MPTLVAAEITREEFDELKEKKGANIAAIREARAKDEGPEEGWFGGIAKDVATRLPLYKSDWTITTGEEAKKILAVGPPFFQRCSLFLINLDYYVSVMVFAGHSCRLFHVDSPCSHFRGRPSNGYGRRLWSY